MDAMLKLGYTTWADPLYWPAFPSLGSGKASKLTVGPQIRGWGLEACLLVISGVAAKLGWGEKKNALLVGILLEISEL